MAVRAEGHGRPSRGVIRVELRPVAVLGVPDNDLPVNACGSQQPAVRTEGQCPQRAGVSRKTHDPGGPRLPKLNRPFPTHGKDATVRQELNGAAASREGGDSGDLCMLPEIPEANRTGLVADQQPPAIGTESKALRGTAAVQVQRFSICQMSDSAEPLEASKSRVAYRQPLTVGTEYQAIDVPESGLKSAGYDAIGDVPELDCGFLCPDGQGPPIG